MKKMLCIITLLIVGLVFNSIDNKEIKLDYQYYNSYNIKAIKIPGIIEDDKIIIIKDVQLKDILKRHFRSDNNFFYYSDFKQLSEIIVSKKYIRIDGSIYYLKTPITQELIANFQQYLDVIIINTQLSSR